MQVLRVFKPNMVAVITGSLYVQLTDNIRLLAGHNIKPFVVKVFILSVLNVKIKAVSIPGRMNHQGIVLIVQV